MELQVGVKVLLKNPAGKYLLLKRNPEKYPGVGPQWDIVGGRIEPGTSLIENLKREVKEETGLDLKSEVKLLAAQDILRQDKHVVRLPYAGDIEGEPKINEDHIEYRWFTMAELKAIDKAELDQYFKELLDKNII